MALLTNINGKFSVSDAGAVTFNNAFTFPTADGTANYVLKTNGSGQLAWAADNDGGGDITGSGTANTVTKFTGAKVIGDGPITFSSNDSTFAGNGTFSTVLNVIAPDNGGSPATTAVINMHGYDGRGVGIKMKDNVTTSGGGTDREWFIGTGYNTTGFNIGYSSSGSQTSYPAQRKLFIYPGGNIDMGNTNMTDARFRIMGANSGTNPAATAHMASAVILQNAQGSDGSFSGIDFHNSSDLVDSRIVGIHTNHSFRYGELAFLTHNGSSLAEKMRISRDGYVGIGTTSPEAKLDISNVAGATYALEISTPERNRALFYYNSASASDAGYLGIKRGSVDALNHRFATTGNSAVCIEEGNFGIGTDSPGSKLEVNVSDDTFNDIDVLKLRRTWSTASGSDRAHGISFNDANAVNAAIYADRTNSGSNYNSDLVFITNTGASGTNTSEKMRITSGGNVGIGTTSPLVRLQLERTVSNATSRQAPVNLIYLTSAHPSLGYTGFGTAITHYSRTYQNSTKTEQSKIAFTQQGDSSSTAGSTIDFYTKTLSTGSAAPDLRMRIDYNGNVGIGTEVTNIVVTGKGLGIQNIGQDTTASMRLTGANATGNPGVATYTELKHYGEHLRFGINHNGGTDVITIDSSKNVGIGTTSPSSFNSRGSNLVVAGSGDVGITIDSASTGSGTLLFADGTGGTAAYRGSIEYDHGDDSMAFSTAAAERMNIDSSGALTISGSSSGSVLNLNGGVAPNGIAQIIATSSGVGGETKNLSITNSSFAFDHGSGSFTTFIGNSSYEIQALGAIIGYNMYARGSTIGISSGGSFVFGASTTEGVYIQRPANTTDIYFIAGGNTRMVIENNGEVGINNTSPSATLHLTATASNGVPFKLQGHSSTTVEQMLMYTSKAAATNWYWMVAQANSANTIIIYGNGNINNANNSYGQLSDIRLKENVVDATPKLEDIKKLKVKNFNFKGDNLKQIGLIAQEVEEVFPGLVDEDKQPDIENGPEGEVYKSVKYSVLVPMLVKAMQEQQEIIDNLKLRIEQLEK